jgi:hypothetical protein
MNSDGFAAKVDSTAIGSAAFGSYGSFDPILIAVAFCRCDDGRF